MKCLFCKKEAIENKDVCDEHYNEKFNSIGLPVLVLKSHRYNERSKKENDIMIEEIKSILSKNGFEIDYIMNSIRLQKVEQDSSDLDKLKNIIGR